MKKTYDNLKEYFKSGGTLSIFTPSEIETILQNKDYFELVKDSNLDFLTDDQTHVFPQEMVNYLLLNTRTPAYIFSEEQRENTPQWVINKMAFLGKDVNSFEYEKVQAIPQSNKGKAEKPQEQIKTPPKDTAPEEPLVRGCSLNCHRYNPYEFTEDEYINFSQAIGKNRGCEQGNGDEAIPCQIRQTSTEAKQALLQYAAGDMKWEKLPVDVFVNEEARRNLLYNIKNKTIKKFNDLCKRKGYEHDVPENLVKVFDNKLFQIGAEVEVRMIEGILKLTSGKSSKERIDKILEVYVGDSNNDIKPLNKKENDLAKKIQNIRW